MGAFLDVARSGYVGLPPRVRRYIGAALGSIPADLRFGSTYRMRRAEISRARTDPEKTSEEQNLRLLFVVKTALDKSLYYSRVFRETLGPDVRAEDIVRPDNWRRVPVLTNLMVRREAAHLCCLPQNQLDQVTTGGSSGHPLTFYIDRDRSPTEYAFIMDLWERVGCGADDWRASFRGWHIPSGSREPFEVEYGLRQLRVSVIRNIARRLNGRFPMPSCSLSTG